MLQDPHTLSTRSLFNLYGKMADETFRAKSSFAKTTHQFYQEKLDLLVNLIAKRQLGQLALSDFDNTYPLAVIPVYNKVLAVLKNKNLASLFTQGVINQVFVCVFLGQSIDLLKQQSNFFTKFIIDETKNFGMFAPFKKTPQSSDEVKENLKSDSINNLSLVISLQESSSIHSSDVHAPGICLEKPLIIESSVDEQTPDFKKTDSLPEFEALESSTETDLNKPMISWENSLPITEELQVITGSPPTFNPLQRSRSESSYEAEVISTFNPLQRSRSETSYEAEVVYADEEVEIVKEPEMIRDQKIIPVLTTLEELDERASNSEIEGVVQQNGTLQLQETGNESPLDFSDKPPLILAVRSEANPRNPIEHALDKLLKEKSDQIKELIESVRKEGINASSVSSLVSSIYDLIEEFKTLEDIDEMSKRIEYLLNRGVDTTKNESSPEDFLLENDKIKKLLPIVMAYFSELKISEKKVQQKKTASCAPCAIL